MPVTKLIFGMRRRIQSMNLGNLYPSKKEVNRNLRYTHHYFQIKYRFPSRECTRFGLSKIVCVQKHAIANSRLGC